MKKSIILVLMMFTIISMYAQYGYKVNDNAEDFKLKNIDDSYVSLNDFKDAKGFIIIFTCNHCPYSKLYEDRIIDIDKKFKDKGYPVIAINPNNPAVQPEDSFEKMKQKAKEKGFTFPYLFDDGQKVFPKFGATRTPQAYVLKKDNDKLIVKYIGAVDDNAKDKNEVNETYLENAVTALLNNKNPNPDFTKAIGCSINIQ